MPRSLAALAAALLLALALAACGGDDDGAAATAPAPATTAATDHAGAAGHGGGHDDAEHGAGHGAGHGDDDADAGEHDAARHGGHGDGPAQMAGHMRTVARTEQDGMLVEVVAMEPEEFTVREGGRTIRHRPSARDDAHLMVTLTDAASGERIPYSSVQIALSRDGRRVLDTRLWPMMSRHVGMHYGENVALPDAGRYDAVLTVGAPEVARHREVADRWTRPLRIAFTLDWTAP